MMTQVTVGKHTQNTQSFIIPTPEHKNHHQMISKALSTHTDVFERLSQLAELTEALLHYAGGPLIDSTVLVGISSYCCFY